MKPYSSIINDPGIMLGKPVIKGTRITVELILKKLAEGMSTKELVLAYPQLSEGDIHECLRYASDTIANEEIIMS